MRAATTGDMPLSNISCLGTQLMLSDVRVFVLSAYVIHNIGTAMEDFAVKRQNMHVGLFQQCHVVICMFMLGMELRCEPSNTLLLSDLPLRLGHGHQWHILER